MPKITTPHYGYETFGGPLGGRYVIAKLGKMRKAREWGIKATSDGRIMFQADDAIGMFEPETGRAILSTQGGYFPHLAMAQRVELPLNFRFACMEVCLPLDTETTAGGITVKNTVQVI